MSRSGVMKWIREGKIKAYNVNGRWKIPYSEIERMLKGVEISEQEEKDSIQVTKEDLIAVIESIASCLYERRSKKYQKVVNCIADCLKDN